MNQHFNGNGALWTKMYRPLFIVDIYQDIDKTYETKITKILMAKYGIDNVRGGAYC
jgi:hypothetical protein